MATDVDSVLQEQYACARKPEAPLVKTIVAAALLTSLAACGPARFDELSYSVEVDGGKRVALFACKTSSSGQCIFRFDRNTQPATTTISANETGAVSGVGPGSTYCATTGTGGTCHSQTLQIGKQTIRHMKRLS